MAYGPDNQFNTATIDRAGAVAYDAGLRKYMLGIYNYMASALALTGAVAYGVSTSEDLLMMLFGGPQAYLVMFAPLVFVMALSFGVHKMSAATLQTLFWVYAGVMGVSLATIFIAFTGESVARVFFITAGTFAAMSLYGYTTKKDLSGFGSFLFMGLIGVVIASIVNIFLASDALQFVISVVGVLVFTGLTAYDTQRIKSIYAEGDGSEAMSKKMIMGALTLYLDFINLFIMLLQLLGNRE